MSQLIALSADVPISPHLSFAESHLHPTTQKNGWGIVWYPEEQLRAAALRDPSSGRSTGLTEIFADWNMIRTPLLLSHLRGETSRANFRDTHPFVHNFRGSSWSISHTGELLGDLHKELPIDPNFTLQPVGESDTEHFFIWLLSKIQEKGASTVEEFGFKNLAKLFTQANRLGTLNVQLSDGRSLFTYRCSAGCKPLYWYRFSPTQEQSSDQSFSEEDVTLELRNVNSNDYCFFLASSIAFNDSFTEIEPGGFIVAQRGSIVHQAQTEKNEKIPTVFGIASLRQSPKNSCLQVTHTTKYLYEEPIERSSHRFRLSPVQDQFQKVSNYLLDVSVNGTRYEFEDVFGNHVVGLEIDATYQEMIITMSAMVEMQYPLDKPELLPEKEILPIFWMPWQAKMMQSYLLPPELPESQLRELTDYAKSFAARSRGELLLTLADITRTIHSDYTYKQNSTTIETTPYEVFKTRTGVCQDFANLMICLARMLNIPARYRVGYIYTGSDYDNTQQSDASHAWVEAYLPMLGWRGFDPTNGSQVGADHIRVAAGRNYRDATPTSGVIYLGGGKEKMETTVTVMKI